MLLSSPAGVKTGWLNSGKILWHNHGSGKAPGFDHFADRKMNDNLLSNLIGSFIAQLPGSHPLRNEAQLLSFSSVVIILGFPDPIACYRHSDFNLNVPWLFSVFDRPS